MSLVFLAAVLLTARGGPEAGVSGAPAGRSDRLTHAGGPPLGEWLGRKIFGHFWGDHWAQRGSEVERPAHQDVARAGDADAFDGLWSA